MPQIILKANIILIPELGKNNIGKKKKLQSNVVQNLH